MSDSLRFRTHVYSFSVNLSYFVFYASMGFFVLNIQVYILMFFELEIQLNLVYDYQAFSLVSLP